jgi:hypothetical protein
VIDQFEEIFREGVDPEDRRALLRIIEAVYNGSVDGVSLILVMRSEDTHRCAQEPLLTAMLNDQPYYVPWLTGRELRDAILRPAREAFEDWGVPLGEAGTEPFDRGLRKLLLVDVEKLQQMPEASADHLPLLQHGLEAIWDTALRRLDDTPEAVTPIFGIKDLPGGSLMDCLRHRAGTAQREAEQAYDAAVVSERSGGATALLSQLPTAALAVRAAFCELVSLDENQRVHRAFRRPFEIAQNRFGSNDEILIAGITAALQAFGARGYLAHGRSGFDVSHEALPRNWHVCAEWLREDARAARVLIDAADPSRELSVSEAAEIGGLLDGSLGPHAGSWLTAAVANVMRPTSDDQRELASKAAATVAQATRRYWRFRWRRRLQWGIGMTAAAGILAALLLGSLLVNMAVRQRLTVTSWIAGQHVGSAVKQSVRFEASELAAALHLIKSGSLFDSWEMKIAHWLATSRWVPGLTLPEEGIAWSTLDRAERRVFGSTYMIWREPAQDFLEESATNLVCQDVGSGEIWDGAPIRATAAGNIGVVGVEPGTSGEVRFLGTHGSALSLTLPGIQTAGMTQICMSTDAGLLVTTSASTPYPNIYQLIWLRLCPVTKEKCVPIEAVRVNEIRREDVAVHMEQPPENPKILGLSGPNAAGLRVVRFGSPASQLHASFYEGMAEPVRVTQPDPGLVFRCLPWKSRSRTASGAVAPGPPNCDESGPDWGDAKIQLSGAQSDNPLDLNLQRIGPVPVNSTDEPLRFDYHFFRITRSAALPGSETTLEGWTFAGSPVAAIADTGDYLYMKDEPGDIWRIALHVTDKTESFLERLPSEPGDPSFWSEACLRANCEELLNRTQD